MARINNPLTTEQLTKEHREAINKMLAILDIINVKPPNDKRFNKNYANYVIDLINIERLLESKHYDDKYIQISINELYDKIFKHRRY